MLRPLAGVAAHRRQTGPRPIRLDSPGQTATPNLERVESEEFCYLWDGTDEGWVLARVDPTRLPAIFNRVTRQALIIDDDQLYARVIQRMIDHGVEVLERLP